MAFFPVSVVIITRVLLHMIKSPFPVYLHLNLLTHLQRWGHKMQGVRSLPCHSQNWDISKESMVIWLQEDNVKHANFASDIVQSRICINICNEGTWRTHLNNGVRTWKKKKMNMLTWPPPSGNKMVSCSLMWNPLIVSFFPLTSCFSSAGQQETTEVTNWKGTREITIIIVSYKIYNQKHYMLLKGLQLFKCVQDFSLIQDFIKVWLCKGQFMWQQVQRLKT